MHGGVNVRPRMKAISFGSLRTKLILGRLDMPKYV